MIINNLGAHIVGHGWNTHCCGPVCHGGSAATGSSSVMTNSRPQTRVGDSVDCGSSMSTGSPNVIIGG